MTSERAQPSAPTIEQRKYEGLIIALVKHQRPDAIIGLLVGLLHCCDMPAEQIGEMMLRLDPSFAGTLSAALEMEQ